MSVLWFAPVLILVLVLYRRSIIEKDLQLAVCLHAMRKFWSTWQWSFVSSDEYAVLLKALDTVQLEGRKPFSHPEETFTACNSSLHPAQVQDHVLRAVAHVQCVLTSSWRYAAGMASLVCNPLFILPAPFHTTQSKIFTLVTCSRSTRKDPEYVLKKTQMFASKCCPSQNKSKYY